MTELKINPRVAQVAVQMTARLIATFAIIQGVTIIIGGPHRWSGLSYSVALKAPGAPASWGIVLLLFGVAALAGSLLDRLELVTWGVFLTGLWCLFFALSFATGAWLYRDANTTAMWTYGLLTVLCSVIAAAYHQSREP